MVNIMTTFYLTPREVVDAALSATKSAGKIQTVIRVYLEERQNSTTSHWPNNELADAVATICTEYRIEIQPWIEDSPNTATDNEKQRKKAVLNQMNNVSKICKEVLEPSYRRS
jgi:diphthamide synthase (EF-2-diphthine--ammonia ligase)